MNISGKAIAVGAGVLVLLGAQIYGFRSTREDFESRISQMQGEIATQMQTLSQADSARFSDMATDLKVVSNRVGLTAQDLEQSRRLTESLKREHAKASAQLAAQVEKQLAEHTLAVDSLREESGAKIEEAKQQTSSQIGAVTGEVHAVSGEIQLVKGDLNATKQDLAASRREMGDLRDSFGRELARNSSELAMLKRRGEKEYFEFDIPKGKEQRVADIQIQLKKADTKAQKYDIALLVDDSKKEKKGQLANEPVQLLVGRERLRYEVVVYSVEKDRIRGYVSTPKDTVLSAEGPSFRWP